jgi:uncharacterized glyoxalase superfamily protein PhnB/extradiol dioxygenase family protein
MTDTTTGVAEPATGQPTQTLVPYITVHDATAALAWYADVLGAIETVRYTGDDGRVGHAEITIGGARIMLSDAYPEIGVVAANSYEGSSCALHLSVADCDATYASAVAGGATSMREPEDQPHGSRMATVVDPFGHRWMFDQAVSSPTVAEIDAAMSDFTVTATPVEPRAEHDRPIQLGYYTIHTDDIARAASFYSQVFGWDVDVESGHVGNCDLPFGFQSHYGDGFHLWMQTKDPDTVIAKILELGGVVVEDAMYESGRSVECRDDQGARFDFYDPAPGYE